jgi:transcriptional regulator with XRE-family HTH domain
MSQAELAQHATEAGRPLDRAAVLRIERGQRGLALDEAVALATILRVAPAHLLSPPEGEFVALTDNEAVDGEALRDWLMFGAPFLGMAAAVAVDDSEVRRVRDERLRRELTRYALALTDASRGNDQAGITAAGEAIVDAVRAYLDASERKEETGG